MNIALDITPIVKDSSSQHKIRGVGFYIHYLQKSLHTYFPDLPITYIENMKKIPLDTDVLHIPYFDPFFLHLPRKKQFPTILTIHDLTPIVFPKQFPSGIRGSIKWQIQKLFAKQCEGIITDSNASKYDVVRLLGIPEKKVHTVYLAADEVFVKKEISLKERNALCTKYGIPSQFILYVGDITWNKNVPTLMRAAMKANVALVMVGKALKEKNYDTKNYWNTDLNEVNRLMEGQNKIFRLGFVPTEDLVLLYNLASCLLMPSFYEGFGLPVLEAMQSGCPVLTTRFGSLQEVAEDACIYIDPHDENNIANTITSVVNTTSLHESLAQKGLKQAEKFTWEKTARETVSVYQQIYERNN